MVIKILLYSLCDIRFKSWFLTYLIFRQYYINMLWGKIWLIDWLVFNANFSNTSATSWPNISWYGDILTIQAIYFINHLSGFLCPIVNTNFQGFYKYVDNVPKTNETEGRHGCWIYNYLCNQCISPLTLWVRIPLRRGGFLSIFRFPPPIKLTATI